MRTDQGVAAFFGRDRPSWGKMARVGARSSPADPELFCRQSEMTFRQRPNGRFLRNLATTRESMSLRNMSEGIFEKFSLKGHLPPKTSKLKGSNRYFTLVVPFRNSIKLLGVTLDSVLTMDRHVTEVIRSCSYHTSRALRHIRPLLTLDVAKMIGHSIVSSRLDYANALLHGTSVYNINRLQVAQNPLVLTVCQAPRSASATELRRQLHFDCQFDSGFPTRSLSSPTRHVPPANRLTSRTSCKTTDQPEHYDHRTHCYCLYRGWH